MLDLIKHAAHGRRIEHLAGAADLVEAKAAVEKAGGSVKVLAPAKEPAEPKGKKAKAPKKAAGEEATA